MPIIIDNFDVNVAKPIDTRFVVGGSDSFYNTKEDIPYRYAGLRIWDLNDNVPYYWNAISGTWESENTTGVQVNTTTEAGYIPRFTNKTILGKSLMFDNANNIGIGITGSNISPYVQGDSNPANNSPKGLHVFGNIRTNNKFIGNGEFINSINASNINAGSLNLSRITPAESSADYILQSSRGGLITWVSKSSALSVSSSSDAISITNDNSANVQNITFVSGSSGYISLKVSDSKLSYLPSSGQLLLGNGSITAPVYSFRNSQNTGFYYNGSGISISILGSEVVSYTQATTNIKNNLSVTGTATVAQLAGTGVRNIGVDATGKMVIVPTLDSVRRLSGYIEVTESNWPELYNADGNVYLLDVYNIPTSTTKMNSVYGTVLGIGGKVSHDKTQLIFNAENGSIQYRKSWYANTAWTALRTILDSNNFSGYALPLSGGTITGNLVVNNNLNTKSLNISSLAGGGNRNIGVDNNGAVVPVVPVAAVAAETKYSGYIHFDIGGFGSFGIKSYRFVNEYGADVTFSVSHSGTSPAHSMSDVRSVSVIHVTMPSGSFSAKTAYRVMTSISVLTGGNSDVSSMIIYKTGANDFYFKLDETSNNAQTYYVDIEIKPNLYPVVITP